MSNNIAIIDYNAGNTKSVIKALDFLGMNVILTRDKETLLNSDRIILPGVGAFNDAMNTLKEFDLISVIKNIRENNIPFLGICLGMQLLFDESEETIGSDSTDTIDGLKLLPGKIIKFTQMGELKVPHMGWNSITKSKESRLLYNIPDNSYFYFVHSYYLKANNRDVVAAESIYSHSFDAAIEDGNMVACQFHPEKSGETGLNLLKNFCEM